MYEFYKENRNYCIVAAVIMLSCITGIWLCWDAGRNDGLYESTNVTMADVESGVERTAQRIDEGKHRVETAEKAVGAAAERIERSERTAAEISDGIDACEKGLDACIQRSGKIKNILADIEAGNRKGAQGASPSGLAK